MEDASINVVHVRNDGRVDVKVKNVFGDVIVCFIPRFLDSGGTGSVEGGTWSWLRSNVSRVRIWSIGVDSLVRCRCVDGGRVSEVAVDVGIACRFLGLGGAVVHDRTWATVLPC